MSEKRSPRLLLFLIISVVIFLSCCSSRLSRQDLIEIEKMGWKEKAERALFFANRRELNKSIQVYEMIIRSPGVPLKQAAWARYEIGFCYRIMKKYEQALKNFKMVLKIYLDDSARPVRIMAKRQIKKLESKKYQGI